MARPESIGIGSISEETLARFTAGAAIPGKLVVARTTIQSVFKDSNRMPDHLRAPECACCTGGMHEKADSKGYQKKFNPKYAIHNVSTPLESGIDPEELAQGLVVAERPLMLLQSHPDALAFSHDSCYGSEEHGQPLGGAVRVAGFKAPTTDILVSAMTILLVDH